MSISVTAVEQLGQCFKPFEINKLLMYSENIVKTLCSYEIAQQSETLFWTTFVPPVVPPHPSAISVF